MTITASPLTWPNGWQRTHPNRRAQARFGTRKENSYGYHALQRISIAHAAEFTLQELGRMAVPREDVIISTDLKLRLDGLPYSSQKEPDDPGAAVWWRPPGSKGDRVIAIDIYDRIADNIYAIGKTLEAMRGIERWGGGEILERTFTGFAALPAPEPSDPHRTIGISPTDSPELKARGYRIALSNAHPDKGGTPERFHAVREAGKALGIS